MKRVPWILVFALALFAAACSKPAGPADNLPANAPVPQKPVAHERGYVVSCAPTTDNKGLNWFESGSDVPFPGEVLGKHIAVFAKAGGNWNAKHERSENRIALRIDARAPVSEFWRFVDALTAQRVYKFAVAMLQEFDPPFSNAGGGEATWELDERYQLLQFPVDEGLPNTESKTPLFSLGLNLNWSSKFSRCTLQTIFEKDVRPLKEIEELFPALLPSAAENKKFKRAEQGVYGFAVKLGEEGLELAAKRVKGELAQISIGERGYAASTKRLEPAEHPPMAYLFLALDSVARFNAARQKQGLKQVELRFSFGPAVGKFLTSSGPVPVPPEPEYKPAAVKPWGDPPGEMFEATAALTVVIEKIDGGQFAYFWGQSPKPRMVTEFREEIASFAKQRDVKGGHPGWDEAKKISGNVLAIRCDIEAPYARFLALMEQAYEAGIRRFAVASRGAFEEGDYSVDGRNNRPLLTALNETYARFDLKADGGPAIPKEQITLYTDYDQESKVAQNVIAIGARGRKVVENSRFALSDISSELASDEAGRKLAAENRTRLREAIVSKIETYVEQSGAKIEKLELRAGGDARLGASSFNAPCGFLFLQIEAAKDLNDRRKLQQRPPLEVVIWDWVPIPPEPDMKPPEQVPYPKDEPPDDE